MKYRNDPNNYDDVMLTLDTINDLKKGIKQRNRLHVCMI